MDQPRTRLLRESTGRRRRLAVGALVTSVLAVTACSSGKASPTVPIAAGSSATTVPGTQGLHLAGQCLREHGLANFPDPAIASSGPAKGEAILDKQALAGYPQTVWNQAISACLTTLQQAGVALGPPPSVAQRELQQRIQARLALAHCARSNGVPNFPDPNPTTGDITLPAGLSVNSPQVLAAAQACHSLLSAAGVSVPASPGGSGQ
jgi:hypothetical protein